MVEARPEQKSCQSSPHILAACRQFLQVSARARPEQIPSHLELGLSRFLVTPYIPSVVAGQCLKLSRFSNQSSKPLHFLLRMPGECVPIYVGAIDRI
jgi:hypothetical protein